MGGVVDLAASLGVPVLVVAGEVFDGCEERVDAVSLVARFGRERAMARHARVHRRGRGGAAEG